MLNSNYMHCVVGVAYRNERNVILRMPSVRVIGDCLSVVAEIVRVRCKMKLFLSLAVALFMINRGTTSDCPPG